MGLRTGFRSGEFAPQPSAHPALRSMFTPLLQVSGLAFLHNFHSCCCLMPPRCGVQGSSQHRGWCLWGASDKLLGVLCGGAQLREGVESTPQTVACRLPETRSKLWLSDCVRLSPWSSRLTVSPPVDSRASLASSFRQYLQQVLMAVLDA